MADQVVDIKFALAKNNGDKSRLMQKLEEFEVQSLSESLIKVAECIEKQATEQLIDELRLLEQSSANIGAGQINTICQTAVNASPEKMEGVLPDLYVLLIEASIEFKIFVYVYIESNRGKFSRIIINETNVGSSIRSDDVGPNQISKTVLAEGYSVKYDQRIKKFFCLKAKQSRKLCALFP